MFLKFLAKAERRSENRACPFNDHLLYYQFFSVTYKTGKFGCIEDVVTLLKEKQYIYMHLLILLRCII